MFILPHLLPLFVEESSHVATLLWFRNIAHSEEKLCVCEVVALALASQKNTDSII